MRVTDIDRRLLSAIEDGLPLLPHPYREVAEQLGLSEKFVIERLRALVEAGVVRRLGLGLVVRHHELGYRANAMVVWDVADAAVSEIGRRIAQYPFVTLCYRRERRPPAWPYTLFCMIHGRDRATVTAQIEELRWALALDDVPMAVLFSRRRFTQRAAHYPVARRPTVA